MQTFISAVWAECTPQINYALLSEGPWRTLESFWSQDFRKLPSHRVDTWMDFIYNSNVIALENTSKSENNIKR